MKHLRWPSLLAALPLSLLPAAPALASAQIAAKAGCTLCHAEAKRLPPPAIQAPSYHEIAAKYRGRTDVAPLLADRVRKGSVNVWGKLPMTPTPPARLSDADLKALIAWILKTP